MLFKLPTSTVRVVLALLRVYIYFWVLELVVLAWVGLALERRSLSRLFYSVSLSISEKRVFF